MSILLEALRKSEKNQRLAAAPAMHAEQQAAADYEPVKKGPLALMLLLALALIAWLIWRQYQPPVGGYQPPVTLQPKQDGAIITPVASLQSTDSEPGAGTPVTAASTGPRTPVENYQPASKDTEEPKVDQSTPRPAGAVSREAEAAPVTKPDARVPAADKTLAPISYWELPDALREDVPEIRFSVLVYAKQPADRFVLVDGQRLQEGDSYQQGLVVEEIRRDGVVFSYRLYRFLVER